MSKSLQFRRDDGILVKCTSDSSDIEQILSLRYDIFYLECDRDSWADHDKKQYIDKSDYEDCRYIVAKNGNEVIATVRLIYRSEQSYINEHLLYDYKKICRYFDIPQNRKNEHLALIERGCVHIDYRGRGIYDDMFRLAFTLSKHEKKSVILIGVTNIASEMLPFYERIGFERIQEDFQYGKYTMSILGKRVMSLKVE